MPMDVQQYIEDQKEWSIRTFGVGERTAGICKHIEKEVSEIRKKPRDVMEWIDVVILALDGAWRAGHSPREIEAALYQKQRRNFSRNWSELPAEDQPSEHIKE